MDDWRLSNDLISAVVKADGAELCSLRDASGRELLWQAGPAWPRHAPILFPIVGRLAGDRLLHEGVSYPMTQHGFARDRRFAWLETGAQACRLVLTDDAATRAVYPFAFRLEIAYALDGPTLVQRFTLTNPGPGLLPASLGAHPAFRWPLVDGVAKDAHTLTFADPEPAPIRRLSGGLLRAEAFATPVAGRTLALSEALFAADAIIMDQPASRSVRFAAPGGPAIDISWSGFAQLGLWSRPGADFLCIEPWCGYASPAGFDGAFADKPGLLLLPPGEVSSLELRISCRLGLGQDR